MNHEPVIQAGIPGAVSSRYILDGPFSQSEEPDGSTLFKPLSPESTFTLPKVRIGIGFHWERTVPQTFRGALRIHSDGLIVNQVPLEEYIRSVISSEMKATAPLEFLKAHAIVSRSWLIAMLDRERREKGSSEAADSGCHTVITFNDEYHCREITRWYDRESHRRFDVCTDDHCQRYQGISHGITPAVDRAVTETRGLVLSYGGEVCDARFSKCCGGATETFPSAWENRDIPYLRSISDTAPDGSCYCATEDRRLLDSVLNNYDLDSLGFHHWEETLSQEDASRLITEKTGIDLGRILELRPLSRGESGRITRLLIRGTADSIIIGKELEIRRVLSPSHLKSSAFDVVASDKSGTPVTGDVIPERFLISGRGWGHGVGLCQIGAAAMAAQGADHISILKHYFPDAEITHFYR